jgi:hypothetical protein
MITFSKLGKHGRLGNQLFQYAACLGFADKYKKELVLPHWDYSKYFEGKTNTGFSLASIIAEIAFNYTPEYYDQFLNEPGEFDMFGYFQSEKYWSNCVEKVRQSLTFTDDFMEHVSDNCWPRRITLNKEREDIAICIRRGDYVDNPNYEVLPITYYILALEEHFPTWRTDCNLIIVSDDIPYCKVHFAGLNNVFFSEGNSDIEDLAVISLCDHMIVGNSSFHWWGAYMGERRFTKIIRPAHHFRGKLKEKCDIKDFYPERWICFDHLDEDGNEKKIDLGDTTFTIPVSYDHHDRKKNLDLSVCMLQKYFDTEIIVGEQGKKMFPYIGEYCQYIHFSKIFEFHRTKMLNEMALMADTSIVVNWDADVIIAPLQILESVHRIRNGTHMVFPYDGRFARMERLKWFKTIEKRLDIGYVGATKCSGMEEGAAVSVGGAVFFDKEAFIEGGMENENFISFGPEDVERDVRFRKLGYKVERIPGPLYHMNHFVGVNSSTKNPYIKANREEFKKVDEMTFEQLAEYVSTWPWAKIKVKDND